MIHHFTRFTHFISKWWWAYSYHICVFILCLCHLCICTKNITNQNERRARNTLFQIVWCFNIDWVQIVKFTLKLDRAVLLNSQYHDYWWPDDLRSQVISRHGFELVWTEYYITHMGRVNPRHVEFILRNINICLHFLSSLDKDMVQVVEILSHGRLGPNYLTQPILWQLMSWRHEKPRHQQQWYGSSWPGLFLFQHHNPINFLLSKHLDIRPEIQHYTYTGSKLFSIFFIH